MKTSKIKTIITLVIGLLMFSSNAKASISSIESIKEYSGLIIISSIVIGSLLFYVIYSYFSNRAEERDNMSHKPMYRSKHKHHHQRHIVKKSA